MQLPPPEARPFDPRPARERMRGWIAIMLLGILTLIVAGAFVTLWFDLAPRDDLDTVLTVVFGPVAALVGAATGFYFGGR